MSNTSFERSDTRTGINAMEMNTPGRLPIIAQELNMRRAGFEAKSETITVHEDCGNAPKKRFLKEFLVAAASLDSAFVARNTTDDIHWNLVGDRCISGKQDVLAAFQRSRSDEVAELIITTIVTHGYHGAADGLLKFKDGKMVAFCDVYQFGASTNNAPIKAITTYAIPLA